ncbi:MAG TPA: multicopper oxidase domain-containing protein, partial [Gemmatimonadaceae bacterium]|nr:multicopper oxidase domain-containing protein [Gemmatimonadaceae bacterium]
MHALCSISLVMLGAPAGAEQPGLTLATPAAVAATAADSLPPIADSDNRRAAGTLRDGVFTLRLEARMGVWHPEGPDGIAIPVAAFAEAGGAPQNPGPLVRVPAGTEVRVTLRNTLAKPLMVYGLGERRGLAADSVRVEPGAEREVRFRATEPGTYYYAGKTTRVPVLVRGGEDSQLNGAIVVDPPAGSGAAEGVASANDRVFVISWWYTLDSTKTTGLGPATIVINGRSWPHTERIEVAQGDSLRWRWINLTTLDHPMHLHGFYFRVDGVGDGARFTAYAPGERRQAVTEVLPPGRTMALAWSPNRPGNWVFHCHFVGHISDLVSLAPTPAAAEPASGHAHHGAGGAHGSHQMAGLVLGINVAPRGGGTAAAAPRGLAREPQRLRVVVRSKPNVYGDRPGFAYVLGGSASDSDADTLPLPGPTLVLERGRPVAITVVNRSHQPAAVHWHGIELESVADGVPGWSGGGGSVMPAIAPDDSFTVRFTPPRAGTFMYHSHFNEDHQINSGLYGPIVVLEPGQRYDPETDRVLLFSSGGVTTNVIFGPWTPTLLNG